MSFEPASPISIVTCKHCQGQGCSLCDQHGIYALKDDQEIVFNLPDHLDLQARRFLKRLLLIKRLALLFIATLLLIITFNLLKPIF